MPTIALVHGVFALFALGVVVAIGGAPEQPETFTELLVRLLSMFAVAIVLSLLASITGILLHHGIPR